MKRVESSFFVPVRRVEKVEMPMRAFNFNPDSIPRRTFFPEIGTRRGESINYWADSGAWHP